MPPTPSSNQALVLEEPFIRTPYELLRRSHRSAQRQVEKDFTGLQSALQGLLKSLPKDGNHDKQAILDKLDTASERVKGLKRKLDDLQPSADQPSHLRTRVKHLETPELPQSSIERYLVDYLLRTGRMKAADAISSRSNAELYDTKLFSELNRIEMALVEKQSVVEALAWCGENRGTLKKTKNNLEFTLRLQEFIELCRKREIQGAIAYSRKYLSQWAPAHLSEIQQGMTLLAFGERTGVGLYRKLYDRSRWQTIQAQFRSTFLTLYGLPSQPVLSLALSAGLSALRLPSCAPYNPPTTSSDLTPRSPSVPLLPAAPPLHSLDDTLSGIGISGGALFYDGHDLLPETRTHTSSALNRPIELNSPEHKLMEELQDHPDLTVGNVDCPTCGPDMKVLAHECAMSHHVNSTIVCRISGKVMDSENEPMAFPNGYVYSSKMCQSSSTIHHKGAGAKPQALQDMAKTNFGIVTCPRTRETCQFARLRKVYIS